MQGTAFLSLRFSFKSELWVKYYFFIVFFTEIESKIYTSILDISRRNNSLITFDMNWVLPITMIKKYARFRILNTKGFFQPCQQAFAHYMKHTSSHRNTHRELGNIICTLFTTSQTKIKKLKFTHLQRLPDLGYLLLERHLRSSGGSHRGGSMATVRETSSCLLRPDWWRQHLILLHHVLHVWLLLLSAPAAMIDIRQVVGGVEIYCTMSWGWGHLGLCSIHWTKFSSLCCGAVPAGICVILGKLLTLRFWRECQTCSETWRIWQQFSKLWFLKIFTTQDLPQPWNEI